MITEKCGNCGVEEIPLVWCESLQAHLCKRCEHMQKVFERMAAKIKPNEVKDEWH